MGRTEAESILLASELRYRRLFESAKDGILILDATTGTVVDVNPYLMERLGFSREQIIGRRVWDLGFFKDIVANRASFAELQQNDYIRYEDKPLQAADGRRIDVEFVSNVYLVSGEKVIQCSVRDISARKAAERQLHEKNAILSQSHDGVMIVNRADEVSLWNRAAEEMFGWTEAEALGRRPEQLLGLEDSALLATMRMTTERDGFWNGEFRAQTRDGRRLVVDCRCTLVRDDAGQPRGRLNVLADITAKKALEDGFLRLQRLEAVGTLASGIAHDLNNILAPIIVAAGLLRESWAAPRDRELIGVIENSAGRGADVIRKLLTYGRGDEGERRLMPLQHLLGEIAGIVRETFPRNITVVENVEGNLWPVVADAAQLHRVLLNLCANARDAMPAGGTLTLTAKNARWSNGGTPLGAKALDGAYVSVSVGDTGSGMPRAVIDRVFDPFFTTAALRPGSGLGLSIVLGIVRSHGGFVTVDSEPGRGSTFHVYLPTPSDHAPAAVVPPLAGGGEMILLVDDEPSIASTVRICLERSGYRVLTARNGQEALELFATHRREVRLVVTDVMMPGLDGVKLAQALRELDANLRVIACSGLEPPTMPEAIAEGFVAEFLTKPYHPQTLLQAVRRQLTVSTGGNGV